MKTILKVASGKYYKNLTLETIDNENIKVTFPYDPYLVSEVKSLEGAKWNPESKYWTIKKTQHNSFALQYLSGRNPYAQWEQPLIPYESKRKLYNHQHHMVQCGITYKICLLACEQGTGKTLAAIEIMEYFGYRDALWIGPKSALEAAKLEFLKWSSKIWPIMMSYDQLKKHVSNSFDIPHLVVFDEFQKARNPTTQRAIACQFLTDKMREKYKNDAVILGASGTPAPQDPSNWFSVRVLRPGFLKEANIHKFKQRLGLIQQKESISGGVYPELITWWDDENKCKICGKYQDDIIHMDDHPWEKSINEVTNLYERLKGLVVIHLKKDCLKELPDKIFRIIRCETDESTIRAAKLILASAKNVVTANMLLRELSDGFQYKNVEIGTEVCKACYGKIISAPVLKEWKCKECGIEGEGEFINCPKCNNPLSEDNKTYEERVIDCPYCEGTGEVPKEERQAIQVPNSPKEKVLVDLLDEYEEADRVVIGAGFTGSIDKCVDICLKLKWNVIRVDGRGWKASWDEGIKPTYMLQEFQRIGKKQTLPKIAYVAQPESGGLGLTLTQSPVCINYSNSFKFEARVQFIDRIHRIGMDVNKGATIIDLINLETDMKVLQALERKQRLQSLSLGEFQECFK